MTRTTIKLVGITAAIVLLVSARNPAHAGDFEDTIYEDAKKAISKFGGKVKEEKDLDDDGNKIMNRIVSFANSSLTDQDLLGLTQALDTIYKYKSKLKQDNNKNNRLDLRFTKVTGKGFRNLKNIEKLTYLDLSSTLVNDEGLQELTYLADLLEDIDLDYTYLSLTGLKQFSKNFDTKKTIALSLLGATVVNDEPASFAATKLEKISATCLINTVKDLKNLVGLDLSRLDLTTQDIEVLQQNIAGSKLKWLAISNNKLDNDCLQIVGKISPDSLWYLDLSGNDNVVDVDKLTFPGGLKKLASLYLSGTGITNEVLAKMDLPNLNTLDISDTKTSLDRNVICYSWSEIIEKMPLLIAPSKAESVLLRPTFQNLEWLDVSKTGVSNEELVAHDQLAGCWRLTTLEYLNVSNTSATTDGLIQFFKCRVTQELPLKKAGRPLPDKIAIAWDNATPEMSRRLDAFVINRGSVGHSRESNKRMQR